jgi:DNA-binding transcriptional MerR regulator
MTNDERQRQMDFILSQQAKHDTEMAEIRALIKETRQDLQLYSNQNIVLQRAVVAIIEKEDKQDTKLQEQDERIARLETAHKEFLDRINSFIYIVEKHIADGPHHPPTNKE